MNDSTIELSQLQQWMLAVLTHPGGVEAGAASPEAKRLVDLTASGIESVIAPSPRQSSAERLKIYAQAYYARLLECLRGEFPVLVMTLGEELFDRFAADYLQRYPPRGYTLARLGEKFARCLSETRPADADSAWLGFLVELAELEWCFNEVFDGPGPERHAPFNGESLVAITPQDWVQSRIACVPGLRLLQFNYPVHEFYQAMRRGDQPHPPAARRTGLVVWRRDYIVRHRGLSPCQFALLNAIVAGETVEGAIERAAELSDDLSTLADQLHQWFRQWIEQGLFAGIRKCP